MPLCEKKHLGAILRDICNKCHVIKRGSHKLNTIASALQMLLILDFENGRLKTFLYGSSNKAHLYDSTTEMFLLRWQINIELGYKSDESTSIIHTILFLYYEYYYYYNFYIPLLPCDSGLMSHRS